jgi:hypothetical protein
MNPHALFLPRLASHLRRGNVFELAGPSEGRVVWSATRLRIAPDAERMPTLQIQIETRLKSGRSATSPWSRCDWSISDLLELRDEADEQGCVSTGMDDVERGVDPVVDTLMDLAAGREVVLAGRAYVVDDDCISTLKGGTLVRPRSGRDAADDWISV